MLLLSIYKRKTNNASMQKQQKNMRFSGVGSREMYSVGDILHIQSTLLILITIMILILSYPILSATMLLCY
ncbi:MAG: hypothetical protein DRP47_05315 [Candidatus Zixiibacteriota bacterium]|nr:MAG: hypothetical protein DRP47_05315 [candidate division Zixibacteria bacterium]